jgi:hypothetical protein
MFSCKGISLIGKFDTDKIEDGTHREEKTICMKTKVEIRVIQYRSRNTSKRQGVEFPLRASGETMTLSIS